MSLAFVPDFSAGVLSSPLNSSGAQKFKWGEKTNTEWSLVSFNGYTSRSRVMENIGMAEPERKCPCPASFQVIELKQGWINTEHKFTRLCQFQSDDEGTSEVGRCWEELQLQSENKKIKTKKKLKLAHANQWKGMFGLFVYFFVWLACWFVFVLVFVFLII